MNQPTIETSAPTLAATVPVAGTEDCSSYREIIKSSSIIGGSQGARIVIGVIQTKLIAILLGPSGVGLVGLYQSATGLVATVSGLGIGGSAVREVAEAHGTGNPERAARTAQVLRRACWATGLLGWLLTAVLAWPLSVWTFGTPEHAIPIALLGVTLLLSSITAGQVALVQGLRRIGDLARIQLQPAIPAVVASVGLYAWLGEDGIVPVLIVVAAINLAFSWRIAHRIPLVAVTISWRESFRESRRLVSLGVALMWSAVLQTAVGLATRAWIVRELGTETNGIYQAAWGISGVFAGFVLQAMAADFYPRLAAAATEDTQVNRLVNEQTEVGLLLALPGLLATLAFAPWAISLFYTAQFAAASQLLPWFVLGIVGRVVSWPLGFIQLARGDSRTYATTETLAATLLLLLTWLGLRWWQVTGIALAFALHCGIYTLGIRCVAGWLSGFRWSRSARRLLVQSAAAVGVVFAITKLLPPPVQSVSNGLLILVASYLCLLRLTSQDPNHRISRFLARLGILAGTTPGTAQR